MRREIPRRLQRACRAFFLFSSCATKGGIWCSNGGALLCRPKHPASSRRRTKVVEPSLSSLSHVSPKKGNEVKYVRSNTRQRQHRQAANREERQLPSRLIPAPIGKETRCASQKRLTPPIARETHVRAHTNTERHVQREGTPQSRTWTAHVLAIPAEATSRTHLGRRRETERERARHTPRKAARAPLGQRLCGTEKGCKATAGREPVSKQKQTNQTKTAVTLDRCETRRQHHIKQTR